jgi:S1-C subfamily serine protease
VPVRSLGIDGETLVEAGKPVGLKVAKVYPGAIADKAGLHVGDVIRSINGYVVEQPGNLTWIIENKAPDDRLSMNVRTLSDGKDHLINVLLK